MYLALFKPDTFVLFDCGTLTDMISVILECQKQLLMLPPSSQVGFMLTEGILAEEWH